MMAWKIPSRIKKEQALLFPKKLTTTTMAQNGSCTCVTRIENQSYYSMAKS